VEEMVWDERRRFLSAPALNLEDSPTAGGELLASLADEDSASAPINVQYVVQLYSLPVVNSILKCD
jgi:hypothetical protein